MKEAMFYKKEGESLRCNLCARKCLIAQGNRGYCKVRENMEGKLFSLVYGKACSLAVDPIEKKPFFHFFPGQQTLSIATVGCNFTCAFCQNSSISQPKEIFGGDIQPEGIVDMANKKNIKILSWTYTEPTVFFEYFYETAKIFSGKNTWVTNGYTTPEAIRKAAPHLSAVNVDYKGSGEFYKKLCSAKIEPVQKALKLYKKLNIWIEITNLIIPNHNDDKESIEEMCTWIVKNLGKDVPLHFSRYFPYNKMSEPITPEETLEKAFEIAKEAGIRYVYMGNIRHEKENTYCHKCQALLVERNGFILLKSNLKTGKVSRCPSCNTKIPFLVLNK